MQPNETLTVEERMGELEEAQMLFAAILTGEPPDATEEEKVDAQTRLAHLFERMRDRFNHRVILKKLAERPKYPPDEEP